MSVYWTQYPGLLNPVPYIPMDKSRGFTALFGNFDYFNHALALSHPGTVIVIDNVIRDGAVVENDSHDPSVQGVRKLNERIAAEDRVTASSLQTVGEKGYDGFTIVFVKY